VEDVRIVEWEDIIRNITIRKFGVEQHRKHNAVVEHLMRVIKVQG
jgi:hypothetical protein